ncbi:MAG TPA: type IV pilus assembly protein PilM [Candidatus Paceibacterota bacterium]
MAFSLGSLAEVFSKLTRSFTAKSGKSVIGIDIGLSSIKVVQVSEQKGGAVLETYGELALGPYANAEVGQAVNLPAEKISEALVDLFREANITSRTGGVAIPLSASLITVITLPTRNESDLASMIPIEARKYIPVPVSEVSLDWFVIPETERKFLRANASGRPSNSTDALLVAIRNDTLTKFSAVMKAAAVTAQFYEVEPFSMARVAYEHTTSPAMLIDLGASSTRIYIVEFGIIEVSHTVNRGAQDLTLALERSGGITFAEAESQKRTRGAIGNEAGIAALEFIFSEARRIFLTYQRKEGKSVSHVVLVGGGAGLKGITEIASKFFDARVSLGSPFDKVATPVFIGDVLKSAGPSFSSAIGLALRALQN